MVPRIQGGPKQIIKFSDCDPLFLCPLVVPRCHGSTVWLGNSVVRVLTQSARGVLGSSPGRDVLFSPVTFGVSLL